MHLVVTEIASSQLESFPGLEPANDAGEEVEYGDPQVPWDEDSIVQLHMLLLDDLVRLSDPETPLEEKFELVQWVYTDPKLEDKPFSFSNCVKLCGQSINPHYGLMSAEDVREEMRPLVKRWLKETLARYPEWIQTAVRSNPQWVWAQGEKDSQYINKQARRVSKQGDLFT